MGRIIIFHNSWLILPQCLFRSFQLYCPPDFSFSKTNHGPNVNIMFSNVNSMNDSSRFNYLELSTADLNSELNLALDSVVTTPTPPPTTGKTSTGYSASTLRLLWLQSHLLNLADKPDLFSPITISLFYKKIQVNPKDLLYMRTMGRCPKEFQEIGLL